MNNTTRILLAALMCTAAVACSKKVKEAPPVATPVEPPAATEPAPSNGMYTPADLDTNARAMEAAAQNVETGEITTAVRQVSMNGIEIQIGDVIGLHNGTLVIAGHSNEEVAHDLLAKLNAGDRELITIYYGQDVTAEQAETFAEQIRAQYPDQEVEALYGGQPFYAYIISVE